eukprot:GDKI01033208.1.p1 GENE.GDKI01033208.1~~GDKI01033208.1.p1  ORF type:complete len:119 (-),score=25.52 GDKI01033208.1:23-379(-)
MVWPLVAIGVGVGALGVRSGVRALRRANITMPEMPNLGGLAGKIPKFDVGAYTKNQQGFESPMSKQEAYKILNVTAAASKDKIREAHRQLMLRNHPDNGGSNFVATKVNEAKDTLLKN